MIRPKSKRPGFPRRQIYAPERGVLPSFVMQALP
jgi:hypothetical protein